MTGGSNRLKKNGAGYERGKTSFRSNPLTQTSVRTIRAKIFITFLKRRRKMRKCIFVLLIFITTPLLATPVQWKIEDGGNGHYYEAVIASHTMSWYEAKSDAESRGGYLATITSEEENEFIEKSNLLISSSTPGYFLGGFQQPFPNGDWQWITGEEWIYQNWAISPDGGHEPSGEGEVLMVWTYGDLVYPDVVEGKWNDTWPLTERLGSYILETPEPTTIFLLTLGGLVLRKRKV
jgi:hypothetical protein